MKMSRIEELTCATIFSAGWTPMMLNLDLGGGSATFCRSGGGGGGDGGRRRRRLSGGGKTGETRPEGRARRGVAVAPDVRRPGGIPREKMG